MRDINSCEISVLCRMKAGQISYPCNTECGFCSDYGGFALLMELVEEVSASLAMKRKFLLCRRRDIFAAAAFFPSIQTFPFDEIFIAIRLDVSSLVVQAAKIVCDLSTIKFRRVESIAQKSESIVILGRCETKGIVVGYQHRR